MLVHSYGWFLSLVLGLSMALLTPQNVQAGGSPETTLVVVNANSNKSRLVANSYVALRDIPWTNVVWLGDVPASPRTDIAAFRERIWKPIRTYLQQHELEGQIDMIAYSAGFPYAVNFKEDLKGQSISRADRRLLGNMASLTGLTFFAHHVEKGDIGYLGSNLYVRRDLGAHIQAPRSFTEDERALYTHAQKATKQKKYAEVVAALTELTDMYPWSPRAWYDLAVSQAALQRDGEALASLEKAVEAGWRYGLTTRDERQFERLSETPQFRKLIERMQEQFALFQAAHGFRGRYVWHGGVRPEQNAQEDSLNRYFLSMMLGYTGLRGNSVDEVLRYLARAAASDGTHPDGTVYLMANNNIRAKTREPYFYVTASALKERGRRVAIIGHGQSLWGSVPRNKRDVIGLVAGTTSFNWGRTKSQFLPGAIAESLTSFGGDFEHGGQTKLSEFLRHGAAGSSGAVAEPYALPMKFPVAYMHVHYADGSSLAEAFYQSIERPYQLIIVGDPLTRPFVTSFEVSLESPEIDRPWKGAVLLKPRVITPEGHKVQRLELWVDGEFVDAIALWDMFLWDTRTVDDGYHDLRIVAVDADRIETRSYAKFRVDVANTDCGVTANINNNERVAYEENIMLEGVSPKAAEVLVFYGTRRLVSAQIDGERWKVTLPASAVGPGPVELFARARLPNDNACRSIPVAIDITPPISMKSAEGTRVSRSKNGLPQADPVP